MKRILSATAATAFALALTVPAFAGGDHCRGGSASASAMTADASCAAKHTTSAWSGAWLERTAAGRITVADVAKGSPAARSGLKAGDIVVAVNGYDLANCEERAACASKAECSVGRSVTYTVQRGRATKSVKLKLEKMPANASDRYAARRASFDPALASVVFPVVD